MPKSSEPTMGERVETAVLRSAAVLAKLNDSDRCHLLAKRGCGGHDQDGEWEEVWTCDPETEVPPIKKCRR